MATRSAGLLLFRRTASGTLEVLLGHMGGPFWARKDAAAWSIPKGLHDDDEDALAAAEREFAEELGQRAPSGTTHRLGTVRQPSGKQVTVFAVEGDLDPATAVSNTFTLEWPPGSGRLQDFPEIDRAAWFELATARTKLVRGQVPFLDRLADAAGQRQRQGLAPATYAGPMGTVDAFLAGLDDPTRAALARVRDLALDVAPDAEQGTGYGMPALVLSGRPLLAFAVARRHLAVYPFSPTAIDAVRDRLAASQLSKGTVRFTAEAPLADDVVRELVAHRAGEIAHASG